MKTIVASKPVEDSSISEEQEQHETPWRGVFVVLAVVAVPLFLAVMVFSDPDRPKNTSSSRLKIQTSTGKAQSEECMRLAVDEIDFSGSGSQVFVPLRAIAVLRECMERRGFTKKEIQLMVDALVQDK